MNDVKNKSITREMKNLNLKERSTRVNDQGFFNLFFSQQRRIILYINLVFVTSSSKTPDKDRYINNINIDVTE